MSECPIAAHSDSGNMKININSNTVCRNALSRHTVTPGANFHKHLIISPIISIKMYGRIYNMIKTHQIDGKIGVLG
ncbi:hypothetical protein SAMN05444359_112108 [Neolewinella agarilytica]|uniref:Uncharacterized protein n=1 Tax=Neolewinella agarilytica TaxID=478744 RepID=A0A1H9HCQ6_9BACT|nr:hypothetical protein SAMN05444359_112108 [Neolewinella agarilytica]